MIDEATHGTYTVLIYGIISVTGNMYNQGICIIPTNFREYV